MPTPAIAVARPVGRPAHAVHPRRVHVGTVPPIKQVVRPRVARPATAAQRGRVVTAPPPATRGAVAAAAAASSPGDGPSTHPPSSLYARAASLAASAASAFPVLLLAASAAALAEPRAWLWFEPAVTPAIAAVMLLMGTTLSRSDLDAVAAHPGRVALGAALQYSVMPLAGWAVASAAGLPTAPRVGLTMVSCCPGGVASNVVAFVARADVPLSIAMTTASTLAAVAATPALARALLGAVVPVDAGAMLASCASVVLAPVLAGAALAAAAPRAVAAVAPFAPLAAVLATVAICASVVARSAGELIGGGGATGAVVAAVVALHTLGLCGGYGVSRALGLPERVCRTNAIEVSMQNSILGAVLVLKHFPELAGASIPCVVSACVHSLIGSAAASYWSKRDPGPS